MIKLTPKEEALIEDFSLYLDGFVVRALEKFKKGIIEHRGEPIEDLDEEIENETIDIIAYNFFKTL